MRRIAFWVVLGFLGATVIYQSEFGMTADAATGCQKVSLTERAARSVAWAGSIFHKAEATGWQQPEVKSRVDGGFQWLSIMGQAFKVGKIDGRDAAYQTVAALVPPRIDCGPTLDACLTPQGLGGNSGVDQSIVKTAIRVGKQKGIPERGWVVALTAGFVESGIRNLNYGDRDSLGWLQQRAGWGSAAQRQDPAYAAAKFYDALVKVNGWETMPVGQAAQRVQISAFPGRYAQYENEARKLVAQLSNTPTPPSKPGTSSKAGTPPKKVPLDPVTGAISQPACDPALSASVPSTGGGGPGTVGTWNILFSNSTANVNAGAGFADLVCLNELRSHRVRVPGYRVTPYSAAVEILWRTSSLDGIETHRTTTLTGYARDKSAVWGVWRSRKTGKQFGAICTHQLVQGGSGWQKQANHVNQIRSRLVARGIPVIVLGDMNAGMGKVAAAFGGQHNCARIICAVTYGIKPIRMETLSKMGSDHPRVRFTFPQIAKPSPASISTKPPASSPPAQTGSVPSDFNRQGNPRSVEQAIAWLQAHPNGAPGERVLGRCERYMNLAYGLSSGYASASAHWRASGPKMTSGVPPRGALVFWSGSLSNPWGHVALSVGGGRVISTDFNGSRWAPGHIAEGPISSVRFGRYRGWRAPNFKVGSGQ